MLKKRDIAEQTLALLSKQIKADTNFETRQIQVNTSLIERTSCVPFKKITKKSLCSIFEHRLF